MIMNVWILLVIISASVTIGSLLTKSNNIALLGSVVGIFCWLVAAYGAFNLETFSEAQDKYIIQSEPALAMLAVGAAFLCLVNIIVVEFEWLTENDE